MQLEQRTAREVHLGSLKHLAGGPAGRPTSKKAHSLASSVSSQDWGLGFLVPLSKSLHVAWASWKPYGWVLRASTPWKDCITLHSPASKATKHSFCWYLFSSAVTGASSQQIIYIFWEGAMKSSECLWDGKYCCSYCWKIPTLEHTSPHQLVCFLLLFFFFLMADAWDSLETCREICTCPGVYTA